MKCKNTKVWEKIQHFCDLEVLGETPKAQSIKGKIDNSGPYPKDPIKMMKRQANHSEYGQHRHLATERRKCRCLSCFYMSFIFKFLSAHRRVGTFCGYSFPTAHCGAARQQPPLMVWSHSRQSFVKTAIIKRQGPQHWDPDLISAGQFLMEIISETKFYPKGVCTLFCRFPFS